MSKDGVETLRKNLLDQQERLLQQLTDLEEVKDDMDEDEYEESKAGTLEQIVDVTESLGKLESGNLTLTDQLGSLRLSTQTAIRNAFHTPEVIRMFAKREPDQLRQRLVEKERDHKLGKLEAISFHQQKKELLFALRQLGERLTVEQEAFLSEDQVDKGRHFDRVTENSDNASTVLQWAKKSGNLGKTAEQ